jgi:DNA-binding CsgD family transcriptional regulator
MTTLTPRQKEVLDLWLAGTPYNELAAALGISTKTVNPHLKAIAKKLGAAGISRDSLRLAARGVSTRTSA